MYFTAVLRAIDRSVFEVPAPPREKNVPRQSDCVGEFLHRILQIRIRVFARVPTRSHPLRSIGQSPRSSQLLGACPFSGPTGEIRVFSVRCSVFGGQCSGTGDIRPHLTLIIGSYSRLQTRAKEMRRTFSPLSAIYNFYPGPVRPDGPLVPGLR